MLFIARMDVAVPESMTDSTPTTRCTTSTAVPSVLPVARAPMPIAMATWRT